MTQFIYTIAALIFAIATPENTNMIATIRTYQVSSSRLVMESTFKSDTIHKDGDLFGGGIVFHVNNTGKHGLICSMSNLSYPNAYALFKKIDRERFKGRSDSALIVSQVFAVNTIDGAKELSDNYVNSDYGTGIFSDWYLPTRDELEILYKFKDDLNNVLKNFSVSKTNPLDKIYWSSSTFFDDLMGNRNVLIDFDGGSIVMPGPRTLFGRYFVRPIRAF